MHSIPKTVSETIDKLFSKNDAPAFVGKENSKSIPETSLQSGDINKADPKKGSDVKKRVEDDVSPFVDVKMPQKMLKRGRPKGAGLTVIGLPKTKKSKTSSSNLVPFTKLTQEEKDRLLLECFVSPLTIFISCYQNIEVYNYNKKL